MREHLQAQPHADPAQRTAASLARTLEYAWNTQGVEVRAALSSIRLSTARGACAPRRSHYAPVIEYRLHACDAGEIRWLRALAERAGAGRTDEGAGESHSGARAAGNPAPGRATTARDTGVTASGHKPDPVLFANLGDVYTKLARRAYRRSRPAFCCCDLWESRAARARLVGVGPPRSATGRFGVAARCTSVSAPEVEECASRRCRGCDMRRYARP